MKPISCFTFLVALNLSVVTLLGQSLGKKTSFGFGFEGGFPVKNYIDNNNNYQGTSYKYDYILGTSLRFSVREGPGFINASTGTDIFLPQKVKAEHINVALQFQFMAGYKFIFLKDFFVMGQIGYSPFRYYNLDSNSNSKLIKTGGFTYAPSAGVQFGFFEIAIKYETIVLSPANRSYFVFRLGFNF